MTDLSTPRRLVLPPPFSQRWLESGSAFETACSLAPADGAGTLVWAMPGRQLDFAVVLEPAVALPDARMGYLVALLALAEALATLAPPEKPLRLRWPDQVLFDGARLGGLRLAVAPGAAPGEVPDWLVVGAELLANRDGLAAPGLHPGSISLAEEEFGPPGPVVEGFAAHLMLWFDRWTHQGTAAVLDRLRARAEAGWPDDPLAALAAALAAAPVWRDDGGVIL